LEQRIHALAELSQLRLRPLAAEQVAAELLLELLDRAGQRGLRDVTFLGSLGEIQLADRRQEISDLMHFHACSLPSNQRMSRKSGYRFSEKDMRQRKNLERIPIQRKRDARTRLQRPEQGTSIANLYQLVSQSALALLRAGPANWHESY